MYRCLSNTANNRSSNRRGVKRFIERKEISFRNLVISAKEIEIRILPSFFMILSRNFLNFFPLSLSLSLNQPIGVWFKVKINSRNVSYFKNICLFSFSLFLMFHSINKTNQFLNPKAADPNLNWGKKILFLIRVLIFWVLLVSGLLI